MPDREGRVRAVEIGIDVETASVKMYQDATALVEDQRIKNILITLTKIEEKHRLPRVIASSPEDGRELVRLHPYFGWLNPSSHRYQSTKATSS